MKVRFFLLIYTVANLGLILYGIMALIKPEILLEPFSTHVYQFPAEATQVTVYLSALYRLLGYLNILPGMLGLIILKRYWDTREDWYLRSVIGLTILSYLGPVVFDNTVGTIGFFEILEHIIFALIIVIGFAMLMDIGEAFQAIAQLGANRWGVQAIKHLFSPFQRRVYQLSGGRILSQLGRDRNVLLLTTKGRRTGKDRITPVFYLHDGEKVVICNVRPEFERTNPWVLNLRNDPIIKAQIGSETWQYHAREATEDEIDRLWPQLTKLWPAFQTHYERGGYRSIFVLEIDTQLATSGFDAAFQKHDPVRSALH